MPAPIPKTSLPPVTTIRQPPVSTSTDSPIPPPDVIGTNTLIVANIPRLFFASPPVLNEICSQFGQYGIINNFIPIKSFTRILIVYERTASAMAAKTALDRMRIPKDVYRFVREAAAEIKEVSVDDISFLDEDTVLRVYYGEHTPSYQHTKYLLPPELEKNWLISPPGSPPVGWEQIRETGPNTVVLPDDLFHALIEIQKGGQDWDDELDEFTLDGANEQEGNINTENDSAPSSSSLSVPTQNDSGPSFGYIITHNPTARNESSSALPQIMVQDFDSSVDSDSDEDGRAVRGRDKRTRRGPRIQNTPHPNLLARASTPLPM